MIRLILPLAILAASFGFAQETVKKDSTKTENIEQVVLSKKIFQKKSDRLIYDVGNSPVAKGSNAFDLLKETPLVSSTDGKTLQISGKSNVVIFINGRRTQMSADALQAFLKNTASENIAKIEVITLPGSEFNVESSDGVINIILKKKTSNGINGNLKFTNNQATYNSQSASAGINARKDKLGITANVSTSNYTNYQNYLLSNGNPLASNTSDGFVKSNDHSLGGYINLDYDLTDNQNIGLSYNAWYSTSGDNSSRLFNTIKVKDATGQNVTTLYNVATNKASETNLNNSVNLNYDYRTDDKGSKITFNTAYLKYTQSEYNTNTTINTDANGKDLSLAGRFNQDTPQNIDNFSVTGDYVKVLEGVTIGLGGIFNKTKTDNDTYLENLNLTTKEMVKDENQSNHFVYDEKISGVYLNLEKTFFQKLSAKIGARMEFTNSHGNILGTDTEVNRNYKNILPTLSLNYNINANHNISYAFTSRVKRPSFWELNPVRIYLTKVNYIQNNPFMKASTVFNQEFMYMFKNAYFLQVSNSHTRDAITQVPLQKIVDNESQLRYIRTNYGTANNFSVFVGMNKSFFDQIWTSNITTGIQNKSFKGSVDTDPITQETFEAFSTSGSSTNFVLETSNNIRLSAKKDWYLGINYFYVGKQKLDIGTLNPISQTNLSLKKLWNHWTFVLDVNDVFKTAKVQISDVQESGNYNNVKQYQDAQSVRLSLTYNFGNKKLKKARNLQGAADDIKKRTGK